MVWEPWAVRQCLFCKEDWRQSEKNLLRLYSGQKSFIYITIRIMDIVLKYFYRNSDFDSDS